MTLRRLVTFLIVAAALLALLAVGSWAAHEVIAAARAGRWSSIVAAFLFALAPAWLIRDAILQTGRKRRECR